MKKLILLILLVGIAGCVAYYFFVYKKHNAPLDVQMYVKALDKALGSSDMVNNGAMTYKGTFLENKNVVCKIIVTLEPGMTLKEYHEMVGFDMETVKEGMKSNLASLPSELKNTAFKAFRNNEFNIVFRLTGSKSKEHAESEPEEYVDIIIPYNEIPE